MRPMLFPGMIRCMNDPLYDAHVEGVEPAHMKIVDVSILFEEWHDHDILEPIYPEDELNYG